jgi:adenosylcobinamide-phosphate guanylyltransferase
MCGGEGTRLGADVEKPMVEIGGTPMVARVWRALTASHVDRVFAATSPATPATAASLECPTIETPGDGYVADLQRALADDRIDRPVLTVAADLPLLDATVIDRVVDAADESLTVTVPVGCKHALGVSVDTAYREGGQLLTPAGVNVVGEGEDSQLLTRDRRLAVNVNRPGDARRAAWLLAE